MNHTPLLTFFFICQLTICASSFAQKPASLLIQGEVVDEGTSKPLDYATVSLYLAKDSTLVTGTITDELGKYAFTVDRRKYLLFIDFLGYESKWVDVPMQQGLSSVEIPRISMQPNSAQLETIEITEQKSTVVYKLDKKVYDVDSDNLSKGSNAEDLLNNLPSLAVDIDGGVTMRGNENVKILINGVPSSAIRQGNTNILRQLQSNSIERIEVITNPSAKYEASATGGIINIVMKKNKEPGFNGAIDAALTYPLGYSIGTNFNFKQKKTNFFIGASNALRHNIGGGFRYQEFYNTTPNTISQQFRDLDRLNNSYSVNFGFDRQIGEYQTVTLSSNLMTSTEDNTGMIDYFDYNTRIASANLYAESTRTDTEIEKNTNASAELRYINSFNSSEKSKLSGILRYDTNQEEESSDLITIQKLIVASESDRSANDEGERNVLIQVDYESELPNNIKLESGIRANLRLVENAFSVQSLDADNVWVTREDLTGDFVYQEDIYAVYTSVGKEWEKFSTLGGLRYEYSDINTQTKTTNKDYFRYGNFFPSLFLNYKTSAKNTFQLSYSRRIERPRFWYLNPFFTYSDNRNFFGGNPRIQPEFAHSIDFGNIYYFERGSLSSSLYYRRTDGYIERLVTVETDGTTTTIPDNIGYSIDKGLDASINYQLSKAVRFTGNLNVFFKSIFPDIEGLSVVENNLSTIAKASLDLRMRKDYTFQIRYNLRGRQETSQGVAKAIQFVDLGLTKDFFADKLTLTLSASDLFQSRRRKSTVTTVDYYIDSNFFRRGRIITLAASYRINQAKQKRGKTGGQGGGGGEDF